MDTPATVTPEQEAAILTKERLRLLSWGFFVQGGLGAVCASFLMIYVIMFGVFSFIPESQWNAPSQKPSITHLASPAVTPAYRSNQPDSSPPPLIVFRIIACVMAFFMVCGWIVSGLTIYSGYCLQQRKHKLLIQIMAGFNVLWIPYGTLLGVATFMILNTDAARNEFNPAGTSA
jgi:hypothetical protein